MAKGISVLCGCTAKVLPARVKFLKKEGRDATCLPCQEKLDREGKQGSSPKHVISAAVVYGELRHHSTPS